jgi:hypothetical protein
VALIALRPVMLSYACLGPALLVLPLFLVSLVNLFVAGPPLKTIVLESSGSSYGASLPFMRLEVAGSTAKFTLSPKDEMTHFFVVTCYATSPLELDAAVRGGVLSSVPSGTQDGSMWLPLAHVAPPRPALAAADKTPAPTKLQHRASLQLLQPLLGFSHYEVLLKTLPPATGSRAPDLPAVEYRLTYGARARALHARCTRRHRRRRRSRLAHSRRSHSHRLHPHLVLSCHLSAIAPPQCRGGSASPRSACAHSSRRPPP